MILILDVDTGIDDALALLYAVASPDVELRAATCVMGNVGVEDAVANTLAVLEVAGRDDVEVARGAAHPLERDHRPSPQVHGPRGLGSADPEPARAAASVRTATNLIVDTVRAQPGDVLLVATGPLTNIALALAAEPALPHLLGGFALMGGAYTRAGNITPAAEANIWVDPEAASIVFDAFSGVPIVCVGLDVTQRVRLTAADLQGLCDPAPSSALAAFLRDAVGFYIDSYERSGSVNGAAMHDPLALAIAIDPSLAELRAARVEVECDGRWTRGMTVTYLGEGRQPEGWDPRENARVALDVDIDAFSKRFRDRLRGLVEARA